MGERKVRNKYVRRDFDPAKVPRARWPKNLHMDRMMLPLSIRCNTCGNYMFKGTRFYCRREQDVIGEGIQIFRFYVKCTICSAQITIKTDPQNSGYVVDSGATRFFDELKKKNKIWEAEEEIGDASMKSLENQ